MRRRHRRHRPETKIPRAFLPDRRTFISLPGARVRIAGTPCLTIAIGPGSSSRAGCGLPYMRRPLAAGGAGLNKRGSTWARWRMPAIRGGDARRSGRGLRERVDRLGHPVHSARSTGAASTRARMRVFSKPREAWCSRLGARRFRGVRFLERPRAWTFPCADRLVEAPAPTRIFCFGASQICRGEGGWAAVWALGAGNPFRRCRGRCATSAGLLVFRIGGRAQCRAPQPFTNRVLDPPGRHGTAPMVAAGRRALRAMRPSARAMRRIAGCGAGPALRAALDLADTGGSRHRRRVRANGMISGAACERRPGRHHPQ